MYNSGTSSEELEKKSRSQIDRQKTIESIANAWLDKKIENKSSGVPALVADASENAILQSASSQGISESTIISEISNLNNYKYKDKLAKLYS